MIKRKLKVLIAPALILGLAACNNDNDTAMDVQNRNQGNTTWNRNNTDDSYLNRVNYRANQTRNNDNNNRMNVLDREGIFADDHDNNLMDHRGPLTENYDNRKGGNEYDLTAVNNRNGSLSSLTTSKSSKDYPHTRAIRIQEARYKFVPINEYQEGRRTTQGQRNQAQVGIEQPRQQQQKNTTAQNNQQTPNTTKPAQQQQTSGNISNYAKQVVDLTNEQRRKNGLSDLQLDTKLSNVAQTKSEDMQKNGYFSHTSPTYGSPFDMMRDFGVSYRTAGENIAQGQRTPQEVVNAWMNSEGHRKNILNGNFTHIGVGYEQTGNHWTQMFIGK
ncbi:CAP domain-containing protein [Niallia sp. Krafla_26]|uniref:CAP domain-containing protein n=1 Tax=Niallia sp. Krafla_26 TaxID=3064703 RepID=UPI003D162E0C